MTVRILQWLLCAIGVAASVTAGGAAPGVPVGADMRFAQVTGPTNLEFPQDHGPHPAFRQEWWYFTGNLDGPGHERFGFELTFFRVALAPHPQSVGWRAQQYFFAHFAITDVPRHVFHVAERSSRDALGLAGAQGAPLRVWLRDWSLEQTTTPEGKPVWKLRAADADYRLELSLEPGPIALNGDRGYSRKSDDPGSASFYYSMPRVRASGTLTRGAQHFPVKGLSWLDREWGSGALGTQQTGWDWFALQLEDGSCLMYYRLRDQADRTDPHSAGTFVAASGATAALAAHDVQVSVQSHWESPRGGNYPARWHLASSLEGLELDVMPVLPDQELDVTPRYWEGAVDVRGTRRGQPVAGRGYVELVGYARSRE